MLGAITSLASKYSGKTEKFANAYNTYNAPVEITQVDITTFIIVFTLALIITILLGMFIFNMTIPKIFPSVRKVSFIEFFGLYIITHMLFC